MAWRTLTHSTNSLVPEMTFLTVPRYHVPSESSTFTATPTATDFEATGDGWRTVSQLRICAVAAGELSNRKQKYW